MPKCPSSERNKEAGHGQKSQRPSGRLSGSVSVKAKVWNPGSGSGSTSKLLSYPFAVSDWERGLRVGETDV